MPFIDNLKRHACASKQDVLELAILGYIQLRGSNNLQDTVETIREELCWHGLTLEAEHTCCGNPWKSEENRPEQSHNICI